MTKINRHLILAGMLAVSLHSHGASFNCAKANTWTEKTICSDKQLSDLDELLMASYKKASSNASNETDLKTAQRKWLKNVRNECKEIACLKQAYTSRIAELNNAVAASPQRFSISGEYERYYGGKPDENSATITVRELQDGQVHVAGNALWIGNAETGNVNTGEFDGTLPLTQNQVHYTDGDEEGCKLTITFDQNALTVSDDNLHCGGLNVTFDGQYRKVNKNK